MGVVVASWFTPCWLATTRNVGSSWFMLVLIDSPWIRYEILLLDAFAQVAMHLANSRPTFGIDLRWFRWTARRQSDFVKRIVKLKWTYRGNVKWMPWINRGFGRPCGLWEFFSIFQTRARYAKVHFVESWCAKDGVAKAIGTLRSTYEVISKEQWPDIRRPALGIT